MNRYLLSLKNWRDNNSKFKEGKYYLILSEDNWLYVRDAIGRTVKLSRNNWLEIHFYEEFDPLEVAKLDIAMEIGLELPVIISEL